MLVLKNDGWRCKPTSEEGRGLFLAILPWRSFCRLRWILDNMRSNRGFWRLSSDVSFFWFLMILFFFWDFLCDSCFISVTFFFPVILSGFAWFLVYIMFFEDLGGFGALKVIFGGGVYGQMAGSQNVKPRSIPWTHRPIHTPDPYQNADDPDRSIRLDHRGPIHTRILPQPQIGAVSLLIHCLSTT